MQLGPEPENVIEKSDSTSGQVTDILEAQAKLKDSDVVRSDTLEELVNNLGVPADKFKATVIKYNDYLVVNILNINIDKAYHYEKLILKY
jgi:hypothetical protein